MINIVFGQEKFVKNLKILNAENIKKNLYAKIKIVFGQEKIVQISLMSLIAKILQKNIYVKNIKNEIVFGLLINVLFLELKVVLT